MTHCATSTDTPVSTAANSEVGDVVRPLNQLSSDPGAAASYIAQAQYHSVIDSGQVANLGVDGSYITSQYYPGKSSLMHPLYL